MTEQNRTMSPLAWALLLLLGLIWGGSFFFARIAVGSVPPFTLAFLRLSLAALALHVALRGTNNLYAVLRARWPDFLLLGLINNAIPHSLLFYGQTQIGAGLASILNATTPIWTILLAHALTADEKITPRKFTGVCLGIAGAVVLIAPGLSLSAQIPVWAMLAPVLASISYGFAAIFSRRFAGVQATTIATGQLTASGLIMLPTCLMIDHPWTLAMPPWQAIASVLGLALLATAFAYVLYFRIVALAGATNVSLVTLLVPASAIMLGSLFLGERLTWPEVLGMALIALGLIVIDGRLAARLGMVNQR